MYLIARTFTAATDRAGREGEYYVTDGGPGEFDVWGNDRTKARRYPGPPDTVHAHLLGGYGAYPVLCPEPDASELSVG